MFWWFVLNFLFSCTVSTAMELIVFDDDNGLRKDNQFNMVQFQSSKTNNYVPLNQKFLPINVQNENGDTPLHIAVKKGQINLVISLLQRGASRTIKNKQGNTAVHMASYFEHEEIALLLLDNSNSFTQSAIDYPSTQRTIGYQTPFQQNEEFGTAALNGEVVVEVASEESQQNEDKKFKDPKVQQDTEIDTIKKAKVTKKSFFIKYPKVTSLFLFIALIIGFRFLRYYTA
jgi:ankyrin repeat protein